MSKTSRDILEALSQFCYVSKTPYTFAKRNGAHAQKYRKGIVQIYEWVDELCYFYLQKEKELPRQLQERLRQKRQVFSQMPPCEYRDGLIAGIDHILDFIDRIEER